MRKRAPREAAMAVLFLSSFQGPGGAVAGEAGAAVSLVAALEVGAAALAAAAPRGVGRRSRMPLPEDERAAIEDAISRAEKKTSGEIVAVVTRVSSRYYGIGLMWPALVALTVPLPLILFTNWPMEPIHLIQLTVFALGVALLQWEPLRFAVVPKSVKHARAD